MPRALVATEAGSPPEILEIELPPVGPGDVRVAISRAGVCHSDLSMIDGTIRPDLPVILGHEASGFVAELGHQVRDLSIGDPVVLNWAPPCRQCWFCLNSQPWLCRRVEGVLDRPGGTLADGTPVNVALGVGALSEQTVVPRAAVVPLPDGIDMDIGAVMGCAVLTGFGAVHNSARVRAGESVAVFGLGGVGLSAIIGARLAGADPIIAIDANESKAATAEAVGATEFLTFDDTIAKQIRRLTGGRGADHAFECVGKGEVIRTAWSSTRRGGDCMVVGVGRAGDAVSFNAMEIYHFARSLTGSVFGSCDPERDIPMLADLVRSGRIDLSPLISHRVGLDEVMTGFDRMQAGVGVRTVVELTGAPSRVDPQPASSAHARQEG